MFRWIMQAHILRFLIFYLNRTHRDQHSFPTRRSSDLVTIMAPPPDRPAARPRGRKGQPPDPRQPRDRKSTRLNSSHMSISYAVFCLKKKTFASGILSVLYAVSLDNADASFTISTIVFK